MLLAFSEASAPPPPAPPRIPPLCSRRAGTIQVVLRSGIRIPYGLCFWAGGTEARPLSRRLIEALGPAQTEAQGAKRGQLTVDP